MSFGILLVHAAATWFMVGLIWFVQVVHYPLFDRVGADESPRYAADHQRLTTWVVGPPMLVEALTAAALLLVLPVELRGWAWLGLALLAGVWLSTALLQVPQHQALLGGFSAAAYRKLVLSNWLRTVLWSARGMLALGLIAKMLAPRL